jgi:hypothetical protein
LVSGNTVATNNNFKGKLKDIENQEFKDCLKDFVPLILSPSNLLVKKISGKEITCGELSNYIPAFVEIFGVNFILDFFSFSLYDVVSGSQPF